MLEDEEQACIIIVLATSLGVKSKIVICPHLTPSGKEILQGMWEKNNLAAVFLSEIL